MKRMERENVIKGLDICSGHGSCKNCGYHLSGGYSTMDCRKQLLRDAFALLKEQEAVKPINSYGTFRCGKCRNIVGYNDGYGRGYQNNFCSECGMPVKWK